MRGRCRLVAGILWVWNPATNECRPPPPPATPWAPQDLGSPSPGMGYLDGTGMGPAVERGIQW